MKYRFEHYWELIILRLPPSKENYDLKHNQLLSINIYDVELIKLISIIYFYCL